MNQVNLSYRAEIDGLRAIAVISVILYHAQMVFFGKDWFTGGFIGVDIFFVISGYLITRIILSELKTTGTFNFKQFYERRARRILPILFLVIVASVPIAWYKLLPEAFIEYSQSILASLGFGSNFFFYLAASEYGAQNALQKPFLHTWSLGVEEQFYLFFPLLAIFAFKYLQKHFSIFLIGLSFLSLLLAHQIESQNAMFAFFLPFTRFWELAIGSLLAIKELNQNCKPQKTQSKLLPWIGLVLLMSSIFLFNKNTPHPSFITALPVLGVALVIGFISEKEFLARLMGAKLLVWVGRISFSLYMWHFPIFAFQRLGGEPSNSYKLALLAFTLVVSVISFYCVEQPFRSKKMITPSMFVRTSILSFLVISVFSLYGVISDGAKYYDMPARVGNYTAAQADAKVALIGDSHAGQLAYGLLAKTNGGINAMTLAGCIPFRDIDRFDSRFKAGSCASFINKTLDNIIKSDSISTVILGTMGPVYLEGTAFQGQDEAIVTKQGVIDLQNVAEVDRYVVFENGFRRTAQELHRAGKKVVFVIDVPELGRQIHTCKLDANHIRVRPFGPLVKIGGAVDKKSCRYEREIFERRTKKYQALILKLKDEFPSVLFLDLPTLFCDEKYCYGYNGDALLYKDAHHLNKRGSLYVADFILSELATQ